MTPSTPLPVKPVTVSSTDILAQASAVIETEIEALVQLKRRLNGAFSQAIALIEQSVQQQNGRVVVTGMGKSGHIGRKIAATMASTGTPAYFLHPAEGSHGDLGMILPEDVVLAISTSGETAELLGILPAVKRRGAKLISMTAKADSTLARYGDVVLDISVPKEACPLNLAPTASTTVTLALGDALAVVLLERQEFTADDFALFHPAGALGKKLLLRVEDVMHSGDALPKVHIHQSFMDALMEMTSKKLGMTLVMQPTTGEPTQAKMAGILTDGDVRRALTQTSNPGDIHLASVMTRSPQTVDQNALAVTALRQMESRNITTLVVVNAAQCDTTPVGVIHLHDILKTGIA